MYYSYVEIEYIATSCSPARMDLALKLLHPLRVGWRNFISAVLEKFLQPINAPWVYGT